MKRFLVVFLILLALLVCACQPAQLVESDSGVTYSGGVVQPDLAVYTLDIELADPMVSNSTINASGSSFGANGYSSGYMRVWQEGKGIVQVLVKSIDPPLGYVTEAIDKNTPIVLKTTDLKIMAIQTGQKITVKCRNDYEAVASLAAGETFDQAKAGTYELDYCRMTVPLVR